MASLLAVLLCFSSLTSVLARCEPNCYPCRFLWWSKCQDILHVKLNQVDAIFFGMDHNFTSFRTSFLTNERHYLIDYNWTELYTSEFVFPGVPYHMQEYPVEFVIRNRSDLVEVSSGLQLSPSEISFEGYNKSIRVEYELEKVIVEMNKWSVTSSRIVIFFVFMAFLVTYSRLKERADEEIDRFFDPDYDPPKDVKYTYAIQVLRDSGIYLKFRETPVRGEPTFKHRYMSRILQKKKDEKGDLVYERPEEEVEKEFDLKHLVPDPPY